MKRRPANPELTKAYPNGVVLLAKYLKGFPPASQWGDGSSLLREFAAAHEKVLAALTGDSGIAKVLLAPTGELLDIKDAREHARDLRTHMKRIAPEAQHVLGQIVTKLQNPKIRDRTIHVIDDWQSHCKDLSDLEAGNALRDLIQHDFMDIPSDALTRGLSEAYERQQFLPSPDHGLPVWEGKPHSRHKNDEFTFRPQATLIPAKQAAAREEARRNLLPMPDLEEKTVKAMLDYSKSIGDLESDLLLYLMGVFAEKAHGPKDRVWMHLNDLMRDSGYKEHPSRGFDADDKTRIRRAIEGLQNCELLVKRAYKKADGRRASDWQSQVFNINDRLGQANFNGVIEDWNTIRFSMGEAWTAYVWDSGGRQLAQMHKGVLRYDTARERIEKRLLKRITWGWRINLKNGTSRINRTVYQWLNDIGEFKPDLTRAIAERLESAFTRLVADGHLEAWGYEDGEKPITGSDTLRRGWSEDWLNREVFVDAPHFLIEGMHLRNEEIKLNPLPLEATPAKPVYHQASIGERLKTARRKRGVTQADLSAALEIDRTHMVRIESGKRNPTAEQEARILAWIAQNS